MLVRHSEHHSIATRFANNFQIPLVRHSFAQNSIRYKIPIAYNNSELRIKEMFFTDSITGLSKSITVIVGWKIVTFVSFANDGRHQLPF